MEIYINCVLEVLWQMIVDIWTQLDVLAMEA